MTLILLHFLGGSGREWEPAENQLRGSFDIIKLDLPGFGAQHDASGYTVAEMADIVSQTIRTAASKSWGLVGHSMGAKVAAVVARRAEDGAPGLAGLAAIALLAGSPPGPEPMQEAQRQEMIGWFASGPDESRAQAEQYIDNNTGRPLATDRRACAIEDVLACHRNAWVAWLDSGSREDWSGRVGVLNAPTLLIAGAEDADLGPDAQARLMAPHFANSSLVVIPGAKHLLPMELPSDIAALLTAHFLQPRHTAPAIDRAYEALIRSNRVSTRTRETLLARAATDDPVYRPSIVTEEQLTALRALLDRVIPQPFPHWIDLAARIDMQLESGTGDGWRFATLPQDADAYRAGLCTLDAFAWHLHGDVFHLLTGPRQDDILNRIAAGGCNINQAGIAGLTASQMTKWFEDLRSDATRLYVSHPATLARIGYSGIANGGDGEPKTGFVKLGAGNTESWEPAAQPGPAV